MFLAPQSSYTPLKGWWWANIGSCGYSGLTGFDCIWKFQGVLMIWDDKFKGYEAFWPWKWAKPALFGVLKFFQVHLKSKTCWKVICKVILFIYHNTLELRLKIFEKSKIFWKFELFWRYFWPKNSLNFVLQWYIMQLDPSILLNEVKLSLASIKLGLVA